MLPAVRVCLAASVPVVVVTGPPFLLGSSRVAVTPPVGVAAPAAEAPPEAAPAAAPRPVWVATADPDSDVTAAAWKISRSH